MKSLTNQKMDDAHQRLVDADQRLADAHQKSAELNQKKAAHFTTLRLCSLTGVEQMEDTPRGMDRVSAAKYIGASPTTFDRMVSDGRLPQPRRVSLKRFVWDRKELDRAFDKLPHKKPGGDW